MPATSRSGQECARRSLHGLRGLALEVDQVGVGPGDQHLAEMEVAVHAGRERAASGGGQCRSGRAAARRARWCARPWRGCCRRAPREHAPECGDRAVELRAGARRPRCRDPRAWPGAGRRPGRRWGSRARRAARPGACRSRRRADGSLRTDRRRRCAPRACAARRRRAPGSRASSPRHRPGCARSPAAGAACAARRPRRTRTTSPAGRACWRSRARSDSA